MSLFIQNVPILLKRDHPACQDRLKGRNEGGGGGRGGREQEGRAPPRNVPPLTEGCLACHCPKPCPCIAMSYLLRLSEAQSPRLYTGKSSLYQACVEDWVRRSTWGSLHRDGLQPCALGPPTPHRRSGRGCSALIERPDKRVPLTSLDTESKTNHVPIQPGFSLLLQNNIAPRPCAQKTDHWIPHFPCPTPGLFYSP